jgi:hypothetical protein
VKSSSFIYCQNLEGPVPWSQVSSLKGFVIASLQRVSRSAFHIAIAPIILYWTIRTPIAFLFFYMRFVRKRKRSSLEENKLIQNLQFFRKIRKKFFGIYYAFGHDYHGEKRKISFLVFYFSKWNCLARKYSAEGPAMDSFYFYDKILQKLDNQKQSLSLENFMYQFRLRLIRLHHIFFSGNFPLRQGVCNRTKIAGESIRHIINKFYSDYTEYRILSFAAGRGADVVLAAQLIGPENAVKIHVRLIDRDIKSLFVARRRLRRAGIPKNKIEIIREDLHPARFHRSVRRHIQEFNPQQVLMMGFPDYFDDMQFRQAVTELSNNLPKGSFLLTANILKSTPLMAKMFLHFLLLWPPMVYRTKEQFYKILNKKFYVHSIPENTRTFIVCVARKGLALYSL